MVIRKSLSKCHSGQSPLTIFTPARHRRDTRKVWCKKSPLDVKGVDLGLSSAEIVDVIRKGRERQYGS